jgi:hypothetical protein
MSRNVAGALDPSVGDYADTSPCEGGGIGGRFAVQPGGDSGSLLPPAARSATTARPKR